MVGALSQYGCVEFLLPANVRKGIAASKSEAFALILDVLPAGVAIRLELAFAIAR